MDLLDTRAWLFFAMVLVGAAALTVHLLNVWQALRARALAWPWRLLALVPPAAPVLSWLGGHRVAPVLWGAHLVGYLALRLLA